MGFDSPKNSYKYRRKDKEKEREREQGFPGFARRSAIAGSQPPQSSLAEVATEGGFASLLASTPFRSLVSLFNAVH